jgi:hypothetical protein
VQRTRVKQRLALPAPCARAADARRSAIVMDPRIEIWNFLHDGEITAISGETGETLTMFVSIPYLRRRLEPLGDSFVLTLAGLKRLEFKDFEGVATPFRETMDIGAIEILSTDSESMPVTVATTLGQLTLDFQSIDFAMDTGQEVEYEAIEKACEEYWTEWKAKAEQGAAADADKPRR